VVIQRSDLAEALPHWLATVLMEDRDERRRAKMPSARCPTVTFSAAVGLTDLNWRR
jgi:hypothetical protein